MAGERDRRQRPFADDDGMNELDRDVVCIGARSARASEREQPSSACEPLRDPVAE